MAVHSSPTIEAKLRDTCQQLGLPEPLIFGKESVSNPDFLRAWQTYLKTQEAEERNAVDATLDPQKFRSPQQSSTNRPRDMTLFPKNRKRLWLPSSSSLRASASDFLQLRDNKMQGLANRIVGGQAVTRSASKRLLPSPTSLPLLNKGEDNRFQRKKRMKRKRKRDDDDASRLSSQTDPHLKKFSKEDPFFDAGETAGKELPTTSYSEKSAAAAASSPPKPPPPLHPSSSARRGEQSSSGQRDAAILKDAILIVDDFSTVSEAVFKQSERRERLSFRISFLRTLFQEKSHHCKINCVGRSCLSVCLSICLSVCMRLCPTARLCAGMHDLLAGSV